MQNTWGIGHHHRSNQRRCNQQRLFSTQSSAKAVGADAVIVKNRSYSFKYCSGGQLRKFRKGRKRRNLSQKHPLHLVFRANQGVIKSRSFRSHKNFQLISKLIQKYARRFNIKIANYSIQSNHIHLLVRCNRRSQYQSFFRVLAGQTVQQMAKQQLLRETTSINTNAKRVTDTPQATANKMRKQEKPGYGLWCVRPFTRIVARRKQIKIVHDYIRLNELEAQGKIAYKINRLKDLTPLEWQSLWLSG